MGCFVDDTVDLPVDIQSALLRHQFVDMQILPGQKQMPVFQPEYDLCFVKAAYIGYPGNNRLLSSVGLQAVGGFYP